MNGFLLSLGLLLPAQTAQVEVQETQLPAYHSTLVGLEHDRILLRQAENERAVPLEQMLRLRFKGADTGQIRAAKVGAIEVLLADGSQFNCSQLVYDGTIARLLLGDERKLELKVDTINNVILQPLNEVQRTQWQAITSSRITTDQLVIIRSADAVDTFEGVISSIDANGVKFEFDGQSIVAPLAKLAGIRFFSNVSPTSGSRLLAVVRDQHGSSWMASRIVTDNDSPDRDATIDLVGGSQLRLPIESLTEIDFSFGSMRFLAELVPLSRANPVRFPLKLELPEANALFGARVLPAASGSGAASGPGLQFLGSGSITYRVPDGFRRLLGTVELSPDGPRYVPCRVVVLLEEKVIWEKELSVTRRPEAIELVVEGGKRVKLLVETLSENPVGDLVLWKQLRFVK